MRWTTTNQQQSQTNNTRVLDTRIPIIPSRRTETARARIVHYDPRGAAATAFRELATEICPTLTPDNSPRIICVTSDLRGQGRSFCAANLAIALANAGQRTLLVDADVANPTQRSIFHEIDDAICTLGASAIQPTDVEDLDLLVDRQPMRSTNASTAMSVATLDAFRMHLADGYEVIVVDAPPLSDWVETRDKPQSDSMIVLNVSDGRSDRHFVNASQLLAGVETAKLLNRSSRTSGTARQWIARFRVL